MQTTTDSLPPQQRLVLLGGGHAHVQVLNALAMRPFPATEVILISRDMHTPYSGMLPGYIAGHYAHDDIHIDLSTLARRANIQFIAEAASGIDPEARQVHFPDRPSLTYDWLSINIGSTPKQTVPGAAAHSIPVKPIDQFLQRLLPLIETLRDQPTSAPVVVVGGGAAGVEVVLALRYRLRQAGIDTPLLLAAGGGILPGMPESMQVRVRAELAARQIGVIEDRVSAVHAKQLDFTNRPSLAVEMTIWTTGAVAKEWLPQTGLTLTERGFIAINDQLQSLSHPHIFAAGDVATMVDQPRPKAGVFAVRQGKMLSENLRRQASGKPLKSFSLPSKFLSLLALGDRRAIGTRGSWVIAGKWVWWWKNYIDQRFIRRFLVQPMPIADPDDPAAMRCTGCGGKVGGEVLRSALALVDDQTSDMTDVDKEVTHNQGAAEIVLADAAVIRQGDRHWLQSTDSFLDCIFDDYRLGQLIAQHAANDLLTCGVRPTYALATVGLPAASARIQTDRLRQIQAGIQAVLTQWSGAIIGGHTLETSPTQVGLAVSAATDNTRPLWSKAGAQSGDVICLTHPIGSGLLLAGYQTYRTEGRWLAAWLHTALSARQALFDRLQQMMIHAATDVSGFGLLGHLHEICQASQVEATVEFDAIPLLDGAMLLAEQGLQSSIVPSNRTYAPALWQSLSLSQRTAERLLYDPQTAGGWLLVLDEATARSLASDHWLWCIGCITAQETNDADRYLADRTLIRIV